MPPRKEPFFQWEKQMKKRYTKQTSISSKGKVWKWEKFIGLLYFDLGEIWLQKYEHELLSRTEVVGCPCAMCGLVDLHLEEQHWPPAERGEERRGWWTLSPGKWCTLGTRRLRQRQYGCSQLFENTVTERGFQRKSVLLQRTASLPMLAVNRRSALQWQKKNPAHVFHLGKHLLKTILYWGTVGIGYHRLLFTLKIYFVNSSQIQYSHLI